MIAPHGGRLINRVLEGEARDEWRARAADLPAVPVGLETAFDLENLATGVFSPLEGFMTRVELEHVLERRRLPGDQPWTLPVVLDAPQDAIGRAEPGGAVALTHRGQPMAILHVSDVYPLDRRALASGTYGTLDERHPGVQRVGRMHDMLIGGAVDLIGSADDPFAPYRLTPAETRVLFRLRGWRTVVGFQTRNVPHLGHEYVQKTALTFADGLFINPVIGPKKAGDFKDEVILATYGALVQHYFLRDRAVLGVFRTEMRYAGPREAVFHAIVRKNFGCTHFIVGRDHAGVGDFYGPYDAHAIFEEFPDLGIVPLFFTAFFYCRRCEGVANEKTCPHGPDDRIQFSGTRLRQALEGGEPASARLIRPEVAEVIARYPEPLVGAEDAAGLPH
ncbi:MAG: sulfate adenylyltransferase [Armatimonadota bacterium]|nr:sulfate adenylyltransferase [Armatimonadota bacterium]MDR7549371.1 sulfate adenylyltransferase [Armatimonadota bacterium]